MLSRIKSSLSMDNRRSLALILGCVALHTIMLGTFVLFRRKTMRRWWVRPINRSRDEHGFYTNLFREMHRTDHEEFFKFTRMWPEQFDFLLSLVEPHLAKRSNRQPLPPELRLALTLSYLAHGDSAESKAWQFRVGRSTVYQIIPETCQAICKVLQPTYLPPMNRESWKKVADGYLKTWQFPNCLGALDGKHIKIRCPRKSGTEYFNYKKFFSIVLMAACDAKCQFTWFDIEQYGSISDGGVWDNSDLATALDADEIDLPPAQKLPQSSRITNFAFLADAAFPLKKYIMKPYNQGNAGFPERVFNYRLSRARQTIENAFGILTARWQILQAGFLCSQDKASIMTTALVCLHNFIMAGEERLPAERRAYSNNSQWFRQRNATRDIDNPLNDLDAAKQRDILRDYFLSQPGENLVPWQYDMVNRGFNINCPRYHAND